MHLVSLPTSWRRWILSLSVAERIVMNRPPGWSPNNAAAHVYRRNGRQTPARGIVYTKTVGTLGIVAHCFFPLPYAHELQSASPPPPTDSVVSYSPPTVAIYPRSAKVLALARFQSRDGRTVPPRSK